MDVATRKELQGGMIIRVKGDIGLRGLKPGVYRVAYRHWSVSGDVYAFAKPRGRKILCSHLADNVDKWIDYTTLTGIEVLTGGNT